MPAPDDSLLSPARPSLLRPAFAVVAIVGLAVAAWWMLGRGGKGLPEDPARVLIVGPTPVLTESLQREGFDAEHLSFGVAVGEGKALDSDLDDLAAILEYADQRGIGYVALSMAHGERYDFAAIPSSSGTRHSVKYEAAEPPAGTTFAVLSVGDLGRHLSYGGVFAGVVHEHPLDERIGLLLALFGQPEISKARTRKARNDLMIRFGSAGTVTHVLAYEKAQEIMRRQAAAWTALADKERGEPRPIELARPFERVRGWPLANGTILLASTHGALRSADGLSTVWKADAAVTELAVVDPSKPSERLPCPALPDRLPLDEDLATSFATSLAIGSRGDALLIPRDSQVATLWVLTGEGCGFERGDEIRRLDRGALGDPRASGRTAAAIGGGLSWADAKQRRYRSARISGVELRPETLRWLDDDRVVVLASFDVAAAAAAAEPVEPAEPREPIASFTPGTGLIDALTFARLPAPGREAELELVVVPVDALVDPVAGEPAHLRGVFPIAVQTPSVVAYLDSAAGLELILVSLGASEPAWQPLGDDFDLALAVEAGRAAIVVRSLAHDIPLEAHELVVSPTGTHAAWAEPNGGAEPARGAGLNFDIVLLALGSSAAAPSRLTDNHRHDRRPIFGLLGQARHSAIAGLDGRWLLFTSGYRADDALPEIEAVRAVALP